MGHDGSVPEAHSWIVASGADAVGAIVGTAFAAALWLVLAFRSIKLRDEGSPRYVGLYRWTGDQVRTRPRAVAFVVAWGVAVSVVNVLIAG
jgi:hypothetical protein